MIKLIPTIVTAGVVASGAAVAEEAFVSEELFTFDVSAATEVVIGTINGFVEVEEWDGSQIEIGYETVCYDAEEAAAVEIVQETDDGISFHVEYPENWHGSTEAVIDFSLRVPAGLDLDMALQTVNGDVVLSGGSGSTEITIVNGSAVADDYYGDLQMNVVEGDIVFTDTPCISAANLVNGSIIGTLPDLVCDAEFAAVDGEVVLVLPENISVSVSTLSGEITVPGGNVVHEMVGSSAQFGEGDFRVSISTVSGNVAVSH